MMFGDMDVVATGGAQGIGRRCAECFEREGATVHVIDVKDGPWFVGDIADKAGFIMGENICIDGGMTRNMTYHNDFGWRLER